MLFKNLDKKGSDKILSIWWFAILVFVSIGIVIGVLMFKNAEINANGIEASVLTNKIESCLVLQNNLVEGFFDTSFDVYSSCGLDKGVFAEGSGFYFLVRVFDEEENEVKSIFGGEKSFEKDCEVTKEVKATRYPKCKTIFEPINYIFDGNWKKGSIAILGASNQRGRRII